MKVLLSIKPQFVEEIISGRKKFEYRKRIFKKNVDTVVIYSTMPVGKIIGEFLIDKIIDESIEELWNQTSEFSGISEGFFREYFNERQTGYAIKIKKFVKYKKPISPKDVLKNFVAPQSYMYVENDFLLRTSS